MGDTARVLITITSTGADMPGPASDLGYLLHKHPGRVQTFDLPVGQAHVFYPEAGDKRCTVALLLEVDPIALVRGKGGAGRRTAGSEAFSLGQYVNDRPYAASSMVAVAVGRVFNTAMTGRCDSRPELAAGPLRLQIHVLALPSRGGAALTERLFGPLGWTVAATPIPADMEVPRWGNSHYVDLRLTGEVRLADALHHLYVLLPVLDDTKHYWVGHDEVDKLVRAGAGWLHTHPERDLITRRYLVHQRELVISAVGRLAEVDDLDSTGFDNAVPDDVVLDDVVLDDAVLDDAVLDDGVLHGATVLDDGVLHGAMLGKVVRDERMLGKDSTAAERADGAARPEQPLSLAGQRREAVLSALRSVGAARVIDLGCGEGSLIRSMLADTTIRQIVGVDVSHRALAVAARRLRLDSLSDAQRDRITLVQSSLTYRDDRLAGFDAVVLMEVIEHVDPPRLDALLRSVFGHARPGAVIITTPNVEYNVHYSDLPSGARRHHDHRFEWTRAEFQGWAAAAARAYGYAVQHLPVGPVDPETGSPTQLAVFSLAPTA